MPTLSVTDLDSWACEAEDFASNLKEIQNFLAALKEIDAYVRKECSAEGIEGWWKEELKHLIENGILEVEEEPEDAEELEAA